MSKQYFGYTDLYEFCKKQRLINPNHDAHIVNTDAFINESLQNLCSSVQVISRNNDPNGNPYRAIICYDKFHTILCIMEARSSRPNCLKLVSCIPNLVRFHLSPSEYKDTIKSSDRLYHMN